MNPRAKIGKPQLRLLNLALTRLGLDREDFKTRYRVASTKDLTQAQFDEVMRYLGACGFEYHPRRGTPAPLQRIKLIYLEAIRTSLETLSLPRAYAEGIARGMGFPAKLEWCSPEQLHKIQIGLIYHVKRRAGKVGRESKAHPACNPSRKKTEDGYDQGG
jgi:hypothetical protein